MELRAGRCSQQPGSWLVGGLCGLPGLLLWFGLHEVEATLQLLDLLADLLFAVVGGKEDVVRVFVLLLPFAAHLVETSGFVDFMVMKHLHQFFVGVGAGVFEFDLELVEVFGAEETETKGGQPNGDSLICAIYFFLSRATRLISHVGRV